MQSISGLPGSRERFFLFLLHGHAGGGGTDYRVPARSSLLRHPGKQKRERSCRSRRVFQRRGESGNQHLAGGCGMWETRLAGFPHFHPPT